MRMRNKTHYSTKDLRAIVHRIMHMEELSPLKRKRMRVDIVPRRGGPGVRGSSGEAYVRGSWIKVCIQTTKPLTGFDKIDFAATVAHELAHCRGLSDERSMRASARHGRPKTDAGKQRQLELYGWVLSAPLTPGKDLAKPRLSLDNAVPCHLTTSSHAATIPVSQSTATSTPTTESRYEVQPCVREAAGRNTTPDRGLAGFPTAHCTQWQPR